MIIKLSKRKNVIELLLITKLYSVKTLYHKYENFKFAIFPFYCKFSENLFPSFTVLEINEINQFYLIILKIENIPLLMLVNLLHFSLSLSSGWLSLRTVSHKWLHLCQQKWQKSWSRWHWCYKDYSPLSLENFTNQVCFSRSVIVSRIKQLFGYLHIVNGKDDRLWILHTILYWFKQQNKIKVQRNL